jgi:hypothetical protein
LSNITCDKDGRGAFNYQQRDKCELMPLVWDDYCCYEMHFIDARYRDLVLLFNKIKKYYNKALGVDGFRLNHTVLWQVCFIYANDLKPVRQFHDIEGGCDKNRRAAFIARLISNHRPVYISEFQIPDDAKKQQDTALKMNEHYALHAMAHFLELPADVFGVDGFQKVSKDLIFTFGHRDPQPESLVCIARLLTRVAQQQADMKEALKREAAFQKEIASLRQRSAPSRKAGAS